MTDFGALLLALAIAFFGLTVDRGLCAIARAIEGVRR